MSNFRSTEYVPCPDTLKLDSLSIIPGSLILYNQSGSMISDSLIEIDYSNAVIILKDSSLRTGINVLYRVFPYNFSEPLFHKDVALLKDQDNIVVPSFKHTYGKQEYDNFFEKDELEKRGSISRGISFGNNQDVIVNSSLNLQLSGKISENLNIMAAISDNNIPIQPDGNSQQIQEFDKVFIQLYNDRTRLVVGDFELSRPTGYFMNFYKKAQGGLFSNDVDLNRSKKQKLKTSVSGAIAKGKYCRQDMKALEGSQGPYKITGCSGESYIIILAGTENVYIDGKQLKRGLENDYVMDYNMAELTFTPNQPITKDKRIVIEFEYSDRNYARFLVFNSNEFIGEKVSFYINAYSENDAKNQPVNQLLTDEQKEMLREIGDSLDQAVIYNIKDTTYSNDMVLYKKIDTLTSEGIYFDSIYIYSNNPDSAIYQLGFSFVGENNGNYVLNAGSSANGKVFRWVAPVNNTPSGNYEPIVMLVTPKKKQMLAIGGKVKLTKNTIFNFETAVTNNDINTFSHFNSEDNTGYAFKVGLKQIIPLKDTTRLHLSTAANYQLIDQYFDPIERFRNQEYERDWNLSNNSKKTNEQLIDFNLDFKAKKLGGATYEASYMDREKGYSALKNGFNTHWKYKGFALIFNGSLLNSEDTQNRTNFLRHKTVFSKDFKFIEVGVGAQQENNQWHVKETDSLVSNSFNFTQLEAFINNADTATRKIFAKYINRKDYLPSGNSLKYSSLGEDINFGLQLLKNPNNSFRTSFNYRRLTVMDSLLSSNDAENTVIGRIEYTLKLFKGTITSSTFYEIGSGLEMKKEFSYVKVAQGQGVYKWVDYNSNNVKELDEFELANFQDEAEYIRVFTPTNEYIKTYTNQFNQMINLRPVRIWRDKTGIRKLASKFSNQFAYRIDRKDTQSDLLSSANPFTGSINDSLLVSVGSSIRNTFSFNKSGAKIGIDYIYQENKNRILLINGIDTRTNQLNGLRFRWNINPKITLINNFDIGTKGYRSEFFASKNYTIPYYSDESNLSYQPNLSFRISLIYSYTQKENILDTEISEENKLGLEVKYNVLSKSSVSARLDYIKLTYNDDQNTPVAYEMLQGFQPGDNATWTIMLNRNLSGNLQMNLNYTGRISEDNPAVHTGSVQLRASF